MCLIWISFKPFLYLPQKFCFFFFFHFNLIWKVLRLVAYFILDYSISKSFLSTFLLSFSSNFESVLFALLFQYQIILSSLLLILVKLVSVISSLSLFTLGYNKSWIELVSNFCSLKNSIKAVFMIFCCLHWCLKSIIIKLK